MACRREVSFLLDEGNLCGETMLSLVAHGSALVAELLRLARRTPVVFLDPSDRTARGVPLTTVETEWIEKVMFDFSYLRDSEEFETYLNGNDGLLSIDTEFLETHGAFAQRCYALMQGIVSYWKDVQLLLERLGSGYFISHTIESMLEDIDGKQLLCEAFFLYGTLLLLLDTFIPGKARERLVITCYRQQGQSSLHLVDEVCILAQSTGQVSGGRRPKNYPEIFLGRLSTDTTMKTAKLLIQRLMSDDIYLQSTNFPSPEHRSIRLASQASMLYVILYLNAETLQANVATMREIVHRHFSDCWVIPVYMGYFVDLSIEWAGYRAAKKALENVRTLATTAELRNANKKLISQCIVELGGLLVEGQLNEQYLLEHMRGLLDCMRRCNAVLRWYLLHRSTADSRWHAMVIGREDEPGDADSIVTLLLKLSQLEYRAKLMVQGLLEKKKDRWVSLQMQVVDRMTELSRYFTGSEVLVRGCQDKKMAEWFAALAHEAASLDCTTGHATVLGRKIQTLVAALEEVEHFDRVDTNLQIKAFLADMRADLLQMIQLAAIVPDVVDIMDAISDLSYAWGLLGDYVPLFHDRVRADPSTALLLRAMFLKLASILNVPLVRISQCKSPDAPSVAAYYSGELVAFVRRVLDVIPVSVFGLLNDIIRIQTRALCSLPARIEAVYLADYAQLAARYQLARLTHQVAAFTRSILAMEKTLLGVVRVDPRCILQDGLRKELVCQLSQTLNETLSFAGRSQTQAAERHRSSTAQVHFAHHFHVVLKGLAASVGGYRRSVEYMQDYINVPGLKMWQAELARVVNYNVERECNCFLRRRVSDIESSYQSSMVPIPCFEPTAQDSALTFMGRTLDALLRLTTPCRTSYAPQCAGWYADALILDSNSTTASSCFIAPRKIICGVRTFQIVQDALGAVGLVGLDRILAFRAVRELSRFYDDYRQHVLLQETNLAAFRDAIRIAHPNSKEKGTMQSTVCYAHAVHAMEPLMPEILHRVQAIGHFQLLRHSLIHTLRARSHTSAESLSYSLESIDTATLGDFLDHYTRPDAVPSPILEDLSGTKKHGCSLLGRLATLNQATGISNVLGKVYIGSQAHENLSCLLLLFVLSYAHKLHYKQSLGSLVKRKAKYPIDGFVILVGVQTILKQCHPSYTIKLVADLSQFVSITAQGHDGGELPLELLNTIWFIDHLCKLAGIPKPGLVPSHILSAAYEPS